MQHFKRTILVIAFVAVTVAASQSPEPPLSDTRLPVHTLLREDIFAGLISNDMERFARGEKNIKLLLEQRPGQRANLLAWSGSAALFRAVRAYEAKNTEEFQSQYRKALDLFSEANKINSGNEGVAPITGGSLVMLCDRLPKEYRAAGWSRAYECYQALWKQQGQAIDQLPVHFRGELLGGLAQSAQRTGHTPEMNQYLDKILEVLRDTPYEPVAKQWKANPEAAASGHITCLSCHNAGRLAPRLEALNKK